MILVKNYEKEKKVEKRERENVIERRAAGKAHT